MGWVLLRNHLSKRKLFHWELFGAIIRLVVGGILHRPLQCDNSPIPITIVGVENTFNSDVFVQWSNLVQVVVISFTANPLGLFVSNIELQVIASLTIVCRVSFDAVSFHFNLHSSSSFQLKVVATIKVWLVVVIVHTVGWCPDKVSTSIKI